MVELIDNPARRDTHIKIGSKGKIIRGATKAWLVRFAYDDRWCWPSELRPVNMN